MPEDQNKAPVDFLDPAIGLTDPVLEICKGLSALAMDIQRIISFPIFFHHWAALQRIHVLAKGWRKISKLLYVPFLMFHVRE